jgi:O-antigen/teichoic acid export membrane protein
MPQASDIRIVKNTVIIYIRMAVTIVVGLITSRLVLQALGASDVGIYSAVGSAVALVGVITSALSGTTIRFMNIELGKPNGNPNRMFNICHIIHLGGAAVILLILETVGIWYIKTKLNVPLGKEADAMFVFQVSTVVACLGIANVPFQSLFNVHEKFATVAIVDIVNTLVKLGLVAALFFMRGRPDCLRIYAVMMSVTTWISFIAYHVMSARRWPQIVRWKPVREKAAYKEVLVFSNYNLLSSSALIARAQGSNMLINAFFGTTTNAAFFYANTLQNYVVQFVNNFDSASAPQITQNVGAGQVDKAIKLARRSCRICLLLFLLLFFPLWSELPFLMGLWLGSNMPPETVEMARWTLLIAAVATTSAGLAQLIVAFGRIKWYKIEITVLFLLCLPAGYILFKNGAPAYTILATFVIADFLNRVIQFILLRFQFHFDVRHFLQHAYLQPFVISILMTGYLLIYKNIALTGFWQHVAGFAVTLLVTTIVIGLFGFSKEEKHKAISTLQRKLRERNNG